MALLFMEGFSNNTITGKWDAASVLYGWGSTTPRLPGGYWGSLGNAEIFQKTLPASNKIIVGFGVRKNNSGVFSGLVFSGDGGVTEHITVALATTTERLEIRRGGVNGTTIAFSTVTVPAAQWCYIEASVTISDTVGEVHVRLNGSSTDVVSYTGDTKNGGTNTTIDEIYFDSVGVSYFTDIYILDGTGSVNNDFLGDVSVAALSPSGNGNSSQLTGSDGNQTDNYLLVDEKQFSSTDYTYSETSGHKDTYTMEDLPGAASTVFGVQVNASMRKDDTGLGQARHVLRSGGTDYVGSTETLSTTAVTYVGLYEQDPATSSAWTVSGVNSAEAGMEVV